mgnify:CR=1 FL=1
MYALVYDENDPQQPLMEVISLHKTREAAERALTKRMKRLDKRVWECDTRIVWIAQRVRPMDLVAPKDVATWRPGEAIPFGEQFSDAD